jgi:hypothetical protein
MSRSRRVSCVALGVAALAFALTTTSCGGSGGVTDADLVLLGFNTPNIAGVPLNQPLIYTFSADIDGSSITPDTLRVVGATGPFFETTVVDGNIVAQLPRSPNFEDYSDAGFAPGTTYTVSMPVFPAVDTIASTTGKPLLAAETFTFITLPSPAFIEPRRPIVHGLPPSSGGTSDDEGCLQNRDNSLYAGIVQTGSGPGARLTCLKNEGQPHVILTDCFPTHDAQAFGTPSAVQPGHLDFPALRVRLNEMLDPLTVVPYVSATQLPINIQLYRVGDTDGNVLPGGPEAIETNKPLLVQSLVQTEIILVPSGPVPQGTYVINVLSAIHDLPGQSLFIGDSPSPTIGGYSALNTSLGTAGVAPGYRIFFHTLVLPDTAQSINESFGTNLNEWGDDTVGGVLLLGSEPGVLTRTNVGLQLLLDPIPGITPVPHTQPSFTLLFDLAGGVNAGQSTTACWNNGFRFLNLAGLDNSENTADTGLGRLKACWQPYMGSGGDGAFDTSAPPFAPGPGNQAALVTDPGPGASIDGDGIYEFESVLIEAGDVVTVSGTRPLVILCRGNFTVNGTIDISGLDGGVGLDTDGSTLYTNAGAVVVAGAGGAGGPGGGSGGPGANPLLTQPNGFGGTGPTTPLGPLVGGTGAGGGLGGDSVSQAGGGGGFGLAGGGGGIGGGGTAANGGAAQGNTLFERPLTDFKPDRGYGPHALLSGGGGGGGGGGEDDDGLSETGNTTVQNGDDAGGGGGGSGGGLWVISGGIVSVGGSGIIRADGGAGGSTYDFANQQQNAGPDGDQGTDDDYISGIQLAAVPSGGGGPGGGGSGGGILLIGKAGVAISGTLSAQGGAGGQSGDASRVGGGGGAGRIALGVMTGAPPPATPGTVTPAATSFTYRPTVDTGSSGQSRWIDLFTNTADFAPPVPPPLGPPELPFSTNNFAALTGGGLVRAFPGGDFDAVWEFQGASTLVPVPGGPVAPSGGTGITAWSTNVNTLDGKRYIRYRWRFYVKDGYPGNGGLATPMPGILDLTIPFKN